MSIKDAETKLFSQLKTNDLSIVPDGVVNEKEYLDSKYKILYIMKEVNSDQKEVKKPLGEDKLIKNANKDLYNEANGKDLSLLKFKSMLRKDTHKFINQKIRPYFE